ncbi:sulfurtransferase [Terrarubrum flagellatum]|uniref:sulfurtransferase n=1 Tax=Terrirubrum flagellatum TaxID=2895980 RepID=UPI0031450431
MSDDVRAKALLTPAQLHAMMQAAADLVILAIQSINPYTGRPSTREIRIPGAIDAEAYTDFASPPTAMGGQRPLPAIGDLQAAARRWGLRRERLVVVYDDDRNLTAARAWWVLRWAGLPDVRVLDGGLPAWRAANLATASEAPTPIPSDIVLSPGHMPEIGPDEAIELARQAVLLDSRIRPNYIGGPNQPGQPPRGHIPGAINAPAPDYLTDYGNFTDSATLREMYASVGADGTRPVGVYCGAGMSAAHTVLSLAAIGIEAAMYPGSWSAWAADPTRPTARGAKPWG